MNYAKRRLFLTVIVLGTGYINYVYAGKKKPKNPALTSSYIKENDQLFRDPFVYCKACKKSMAAFWFNGGHKQTKPHVWRSMRKRSQTR